ncbi:MAG: helix-turn-helix transcriptional regulator [Muribaculaceae bacterium]|nr:helix-turn-helix transcriptional regulator [Muribaculaceae bacterium]
MKSIHNKAYQQLLSLLRSKRLDRGITQEELASRLGVGQGIVSKIETHERRLDLIELREICLALGISFPEFVMEFDYNLTQEENHENEKD